MNDSATQARPAHNDFGQLLRMARVRQGATQRQLADLSTVSVRAIRDLETGRAQRPRPDTVRLIADGLGLSGRVRVAFESSARATGRLSADADTYGGPPPVLDSLIGRERDEAVLRDLLVGGDQRLVTVVGVGGVGKTRLTQHVAAGLHGSGRVRVCWIAEHDARDEPSVGTETAARWADGPSLLVLDGYRPDPAHAERLISLLGSCPSLRVLVTARAPLEVVGERTFPLAPLPVPAADRAADDAPALAMLIRCVRQSRPDFSPDRAELTALAALCRHLDGIPSALEAAARWLVVFEPAELLAQVRADPFAIVGNDLLDDPLRADAGEQALLRDLTEIDGPWSIAEMVAVTGASLVACHRLLHRLLLRGVVARGGTADGPQFRLLELVRAGCRARTLRFAEPA